MKTNIFIILAGCFLCACNKQLNVLPTTSKVDGNVITDPKSAAVALNGVYYRFAAGGEDNNTVPTIQWYDVNEDVPSQLSGLLDNISNDELTQHTYKPTSNFVGNMWNYGYAIVNAANGFLKNLTSAPGIPAETKRQMNNEARFLRAFANSWLLRYFGQYTDASSEYGIIVRDEFVGIGNINLPRSTVAVTYDRILTDLDSAIAGLPDRNTQISYTNVWAAKLLKARVLMNRGAADDLAQVIALTTDIIANSRFTLENNVKDIFLSKGLSSNEVMLGVQPFATQNIKYTQYISYGQFPPSSLLMDLLDNDPRHTWMDRDILNRYGDTLPLFTKYYPGDAYNTAVAAVGENCYAMRLTEAYLLKAEALATSGGSLADAKALLKTVMGHAGITDFSAVDNENDREQLRQLVIKETLKNFAAESGQDWDALRRLPFTVIQGMIPSITSKTQLTLPVPNDEMVRNSAARQNPGY